MAWTAPITWLDGQKPAAADFNPQIRDNLLYLKAIADVAAQVGAINIFSTAQDFSEIATPSAPAAGRSRLFAGNSGVNNGVLSCLDDAGTTYQMVAYGTGTFTPTFASSNANGSWTYAQQVGRYTRIGNRVFFQLTVWAASRPGTPTGDAWIAGLPIPSANVTQGHCPVSVDTMDAIDLLAGTRQLSARVPPNSTRIELIENPDNASVSALPATSWGAASIIRIGGSYEI